MHSFQAFVISERKQDDRQMSILLLARDCACLERGEMVRFQWVAFYSVRCLMAVIQCVNKLVSIYLVTPPGGSSSSPETKTQSTEELPTFAQVLSRIAHIGSHQDTHQWVTAKQRGVQQP